MARDFVIAGECLVLVKGRTDSAIANLTQLALSASPIRITPEFRHLPIHVDAWGEAPVDIQFMLATVDIVIDMIHVDWSILDVCTQLSMGGAPSIGSTARAGQRLGNGMARFAPSVVSPATGYGAGNNLIGLNISSPVVGKPWRFLYSFMTAPPWEFPIGAEKSVVRTNWRAIPYTIDPYNGGLGAYGTPLWDHQLDS